jgi:hypothetical protein
VGPSFGDTYTLTMNATANDGGYWANPDAALGSMVLGNYALATKDSNLGFWTMCVETNEYFWPGSKYNAAVVGTTAHNGGTNTTTGDRISVGTAYLYEQFALGNLPSLLSSHGFGTFAYNVTDAARVQNMIWYLEDETGEGTITPDPSLVALLTWAIPGGLTAWHADYAGLDVMVMNLTWFNGQGGDPGGSSYGNGLRQDQLVLWHVPDGGSTAALLGAALMAIAAFRRRR